MNTIEPRRLSHHFRSFRPSWQAIRIELIASPVTTLATALFYLAFIERTTFVYHGEKFYTLFDDAMISMRYARNLAEGQGLVWNPGAAPVEGYTNPLWTLWMALVHWAGIPETAIGLVIALSGAALVLGTALLIRSIARTLYPQQHWLTSLAFWGTVLYYPLVFWALRGMEVGLISFLLAASVLCALRLEQEPSRFWLGCLALCSVLGVLTRMEYCVPAAVIAAFVWWRVSRGWRVALVVPAVVALSLASLTLFRLLYYGEVLPNTYYLKVDGIALDVRLARGVLTLLGVQVTHLLGLSLLALPLVLQNPRRMRPGDVLLLSIVLSLCAYSVWTGGDAWENYGFANRYVAPAIPLALILVLSTIEALVARRSPWLTAMALLLILAAGLNLFAPQALRGISQQVVAASYLALAISFLAIRHEWLRFIPSRSRAILVGALVVLSLNLPPFYSWYAWGAPQSDGDAAWSAFGLLIRDTTSADATLAVTWAGAVSYFSQRQTYDQLGKTDEVIAKGPSVTDDFRPGHSKWNFEHTIGELRPDLVMAFYFATAADFDFIRAQGYLPLNGSCLYQVASSRIDLQALQQGLQELQSDARLKGWLCTRQHPDSAVP